MIIFSTTSQHKFIKALHLKGIPFLFMSREKMTRDVFLFLMAVAMSEMDLSYLEFESDLIKLKALPILISSFLVLQS